MQIERSIFKLLYLVSISFLVACAGPVTKPASLTTTLTPNQQSLQDIRDLILQQDINNAQAILYTLDFDQLTQAEQQQHLFLNIKLSVLSQDIQQAQQLFNGPQQHLLNSLADDQQIELSLLRAQAYEFNQQFLSAARERIYLAPLLTGDTYQLNHQKIWHNLLQINPEQLQHLQQTITTPYDYQGWIALANISKQHQFDIDQQLSQITQWLSEFPAHPAAKELPGGLHMLPELIKNRPQKIALLLPLSGRLSATGNAVKDGFMAAYYQNLSQSLKVPEILILDSSSGSILQHYQNAISQGAQLVVGPLQKSKLEQLNQQTELPIPVLGLNYTGSAMENAGNLFQFGLSPEDEVRQVAQQAWRDGHKKVAVLALKGAWGERNYNAFAEEWLLLGGKIAEVQYYQRNKDYNTPIKKLLNIDESQARARKLRSVLRDKIEFTSRRRQDIDWIFLLAFPKEGRQIKPALAFHFAGELPVYATSHIYNGKQSFTYNRDLNGVNFCDTPWILHNDPLKSELHNHYSKRLSSQSRLFALGIDAFQLHPRLQLLKAIPYSRFHGKSGTLSLDDSQRIHRQLTWAQFKRGRAQLSHKNL